MENNKKLFSDIAFDFQRAECEFENSLFDEEDGKGLEDYSTMSFDSYDYSIEFNDVPDDERLSDRQQEIIFNEGFLKCYLNHKNNWETHYTWNYPFEPVEGWRIRYMRKSEKNYHEVEKIPESWPSDMGCKVVNTDDEH